MRLWITLAALLLAACSGSSEITTVEATDGHAFQPNEITVGAGETVEFRNISSEPHTVTAYEDSLPEGADYFASGGADSEQDARSSVADGLLTEGETYEVTLDVPGTYRYFCIPHEADGMTGTIRVLTSVSPQ